MRVHDALSLTAVQIAGVGGAVLAICWTMIAPQVRHSSSLLRKMVFSPSKKPKMAVRKRWIIGIDCQRAGVAALPVKPSIDWQVGRSVRTDVSLADHVRCIVRELQLLAD